LWCRWVLVMGIWRGSGRGRRIGRKEGVVY
jgi:hypothetical protein